MSSSTAANGEKDRRSPTSKLPSQRHRNSSSCTVLGLALLVFVGSQITLLCYFHSSKLKELTTSSASLAVSRALEDFLSPVIAATGVIGNNDEGDTTGGTSGDDDDSNTDTKVLSRGYKPPEKEKISVLDMSNQTKEDPAVVVLNHDATLTVTAPPQTNSTETDLLLPPWLKEYFAWHQQQRRDLTPENFSEKRFLVMQCLARDRCGGTADRIKPVPVMLWFAASSNRILLIRWERPAKLEEFLLPPMHGGLDWRVPDWLTSHIGDNRGPYFGACDSIYKALQNSQHEVFIRTKYQSHNAGQPYFDENTPPGTANYTEVYHDVWRTMFTPSPPVAKIIQDTQDRLGLSPGNYAAAHFRALYARAERPVQETKEWAINAVNCASELRPGGPVYFASDTRVAIDAVQEYAKETNRTIVSLIHDTEPLHLEKVENWTAHPPSDFYSTFVDLYLLGMSRCVSYNVGGFGRWGLMISYNASCEKMHSKRSMNKCEWTEPEEGAEPAVSPHNDVSLRTPVHHESSTKTITA